MNKFDTRTKEEIRNDMIEEMISDGFPREQAEEQVDASFFQPSWQPLSFIKKINGKPTLIVRTGDGKYEYSEMKI